MKEAILALGEEEAGTEGTIGSDRPERTCFASRGRAGQVLTVGGAHGLRAGQVSQ
jgi:hypothetical protein